MSHITNWVSQTTNSVSHITNWVSYVTKGQETMGESQTPLTTLSTAAILTVIVTAGSGDSITLMYRQSHASLLIPGSWAAQWRGRLAR